MKCDIEFLNLEFYIGIELLLVMRVDNYMFKNLLDDPSVTNTINSSICKYSKIVALE
jgi:hypothetical protein